MNLDSNPKTEELRDLIRRCDDTAGHHVLWIKRTGDVELSKIPDGTTPTEFDQRHKYEMQMRCETFLAGNEYVGPEAADDKEWVSELFDRLVKEWLKTKGKPEVGYLDKF